MTIENEREAWQETIENNVYVICKTPNEPNEK